STDARRRAPPGCGEGTVTNGPPFTGAQLDGAEQRPRIPVRTAGGRAAEHTRLRRWNGGAHPDHTSRITPPPPIVSPFSDLVWRGHPITARQSSTWTSSGV